jgi:hypothetical protein
MRALTMLAVFTAAGCSWMSPLMKPAPAACLSTLPAPDKARVVFAHGGANELHGVGTVRIVDEAGSVLGDSLPYSWFAVDLPPGRHSFFGWQTSANGRFPQPNGCACFLHECWWVAAMRADLAAGRTYYVWVQQTKAFGAPGDISSWDQQIDFVRVSPQLDTWPRERRDEIRPMVRDERDAERPEVYRDSFVCVGQARVRRGTYWDADLSTLQPEDGS